LTSPDRPPSTTRGGPLYIDDSLIRGASDALYATDEFGEGSINGLNDTLIDTGPPGQEAFGAYAQGSTANNGTDIQLVNSIVRGFVYSFANSGSASSVEAFSDNYDGVTTGDHTSVTPSVGGDPMFADPANGNYHLAADSPLIDASSTADLGSISSTTDLDGNPRVVVIDHSATPVDLGAYEYQPPSTSTGGAGNPGGTPGGTPGGGNPGGGNPGGGSGTPSTGTPSRGSRPTRPAHPAATVKLTPLGHISVTGKRISLRLACTGTAVCSPIKVTATAMTHHHRVTVGTPTTHLGAGHKATLTLTLNRAGRALLASTGRLTVALTVTVRNGARTLTVETAHVRLT
jgi:hypothetical protein